MSLLKLIGEQTDVAFTLAKHILTTEAKAKDSNFVFSPLSIQVLLSLIAAGSKGATLEQLLSFLKAKSSDELASLSSEILAEVFSDGSGSGGLRLSFANGVWVDKSLTLKHSFKQVAETAYKADANQLDFKTKAIKATKEVNAWVEKATNGLIKDILSEGSVNSFTRLVLANALYFKGEWDEEFDSSLTKQHDFYLLNGSTIRVPFVTCSSYQFVSAFNDFKVLRLPYKQRRDKRQFSMYFFLPDANDGLPSLVEKIGTESRFLDRHFPQRRIKVRPCRIPKFKISFGLEASDVLKRLGLSLPFTRGDLTEIVEDSSEGRHLFVSVIYHKAFIQVNEKGTEAAAVSCEKVCGYAMFNNSPKKIIDFVADHPFLFVIREDVSGVVLFIGQCCDPSPTNEKRKKRKRVYTG